MGPELLQPTCFFPRGAEGDADFCTVAGSHWHSCNFFLLAAKTDIMGSWVFS